MDIYDYLSGKNLNGNMFKAIHCRSFIGKKWEILNHIGFVGTIQVEFLVRVKFNVLINLELSIYF